MKKSIPLFALLALLLAAPLAAQTQQAAATPTGAGEADYERERHMVESVLRTVVSVIQDVTLQHEDTPAVGDRLRLMAGQLSDAAQSFDLKPDATETAAVTSADLQRLERMLRDLQTQLQEIQQELQDGGNTEIADKLRPIDRGLNDAVGTVRDMITGETTDPYAAEPEPRRTEGDDWLRPGRYDRGQYEPRDGRRDEDWAEDERIQDRIDDRIQHVEDRARRIADRYEDRNTWICEGPDGDDCYRVDRYNRDDWRYRSGYDFDWHSDMGTFVGDLPTRWPYRETALYRPIPAIRYNRVEGFVVGIRRRPLEWDSYSRGKIFGQVGYAFGMDDIRYEVAAEQRFGRRYGGGPYDFKVGGGYRQNTFTNDLWKSSWAENSLGAFFFKSDFFDYYEVEGWTLYAVARVTPFFQFGAGYRSDDYSTLRNETSWSLFGGEAHRVNPAIDEGRMQSFVFSAEGGKVRSLDYLPRGVAFRAEAEVSEGLGGDFSFARFLGDVRAYVAVTRFSNLSMRLRAGYMTGDDMPFQKMFTVGGVGTSRAYPQNFFIGSRMLLANAEFAFYEAEILDEFLEDFQVFGLFDAAWVNNNRNAFDVGDVIPSAGFGLGFWDRSLRLELAWPLRDLTGTKEPTLWFRINPTF